MGGVCNSKKEFTEIEITLFNKILKFSKIIKTMKCNKFDAKKSYQTIVYSTNFEYEDDSNEEKEDLRTRKEGFNSDRPLETEFDKKTDKKKHKHNEIFANINLNCLSNNDSFAKINDVVIYDNNENILSLLNNKRMKSMIHSTHTKDYSKNDKVRIEKRRNSRRTSQSEEGLKKMIENSNNGHKEDESNFKILI
jgi:hypothetical protein